MALLAGMLGIGGGVIINPMLIEVTAARSSFMIFFASCMSVLEFWLLGRGAFRFTSPCCLERCATVFSCRGNRGTASGHCEVRSAISDRVLGEQRHGVQRFVDGYFRRLGCLASI